MGKRQLALEFLRACDLLIFSAAYAYSYFLARPEQSHATFWSQLATVKLSLADLIFIVLAPLVWNRAFSIVGAYKSQRLSGFWSQQGVVLKATSIGTLAVVLVCLATGRNYGATFIVLLWSYSTAGTLIYRILLRFILRRLRLRGRNLRGVLIVGTDERARRFGQSLLSHREFGYMVIGYLFEKELEEPPQAEIQVIGAVESLAEVLREKVVDEVAISLPMQSHFEQIVEITTICRGHGIITRIIADSIEPRLKIARMDDFDGCTLLTVSPESRLRAGPVAKQLFDSCGASILILLLLPAFILAALAIRLTSPGPIFYVQIRIGRNKRRFGMYKFRTMVVDAEARLPELVSQTGAGPIPFKMRNDPRVTPVGRILRRFSIDELPQLFNVLKGDMSLVGPRPLPVRDYEGFEREHHFRRFSVKPGLSCLWQISGRSDLNFEQWMELDMKYIDQWSMWLDLKILAKTIPVVFRGTGAY